MVIHYSLLLVPLSSCAEEYMDPPWYERDEFADIVRIP